MLFLPPSWSAFGAHCIFPRNEFPHAHKITQSVDDIESLPQPNPKTDGLLPFMLNRLKLARQKFEAAGHKIRFAAARGPVNT